MMLRRNCEVCRKPFTVKSLNQKFCSRDCYRKASNRYHSGENFQEGTIYQLDMREWKWIEQKRGSK